MFANRIARSMLTVAMLAPFFSGCDLFNPGGGGGPGPEQTQWDAKGAVQAGDLGLNPTTLKVETALGTAAVGANGGFDAKTLSSGPSLAVVRGPDGKTVFLGMLYGAEGHDNTLGIRSTAVALLNVAIGSFLLPADQQAEALTMIHGSQATVDFAVVLADMLKRNPAALDDGDDQLAPAILTARAALLGKSNGRAKRTKAEFVPDRFMQSSEEEPVALLTIDPQGGVEQSGVEILQNPDGPGFIGMNHRRRRCKIFVYKTANEDENGVKTNVIPPESVGDAHALPTTQRLDLLNAITDIFTASAPWSPVNSEPMTVTVSSGAKKTYYDVIVIGPSTIANAETGPYNLAKYASAVPVWQNTRTNEMVNTLFLDVAYPLLKFIFGAGSASAAGASAEAQASALMNLYAQSVPNLLQMAHEGNLATAFKAIQQVAANSTIVSNSTFQILANANSVIQTGLLHGEEAVAKAQRMMKAAWFIAVVDTILTVGDFGALIQDITTSNGAEQWAVTAARPTVHLDPASGRVVSPETKTLTASVTFAAGAQYRYKWSTEGKYGKISASGSGPALEIETDSKTCVYTPQTDPPDGQVERISLKAYLKGDGDALHYLGEAISEITVYKNPPCDELNTGPYTSGCGNVSVSPSEVRAGDILTVTANVGCGGGTLSIDYADPTEVYVDGVKTTTFTGYPSLYSYDPPRPVARGGGIAVALTGGSHTVTVRIKLSAPNDCLNITASNQAVGPWVFLGGSSPNRWSSVQHFRVRAFGL